jgi:lactocepin
MMLSKSLVSVFAALAALSSVAAAAPPVNGSGNNGGGNNGGGNDGGKKNGDGNNGGYASPSNPTTVNSCGGGSIVCCGAFTTGQDAGSAVSSLLGSLPPQTTYVGLTCTSVVDNQW